MSYSWLRAKFFKLMIFKWTSQLRTVLVLLDHEVVEIWRIRYFLKCLKVVYFTSIIPYTCVLNMTIQHFFSINCQWQRLQIQMGQGLCSNWSICLIILGAGGKFKKQIHSKTGKGNGLIFVYLQVTRNYGCTNSPIINLP